MWLIFSSLVEVVDSVDYTFVSNHVEVVSNDVELGI